MKNLNKFIQRRNDWMGIFNKAAPYSFPLTQQQVDDLAQELDCELSTENLHCDGEISVAEADAKYRFFAMVAQELEAYCRSNSLTMPEIYEL